MELVFSQYHQTVDYSIFLNDSSIVLTISDNKSYKYYINLTFAKKLPYFSASTFETNNSIYLWGN